MTEVEKLAHALRQSSRPVQSTMRTEAEKLATIAILHPLVQEKMAAGGRGLARPDISKRQLGGRDE